MLKITTLHCYNELDLQDADNNFGRQNDVIIIYHGYWPFELAVTFMEWLFYSKV